MATTTVKIGSVLSIIILVSLVSSSLLLVNMLSSLTPWNPVVTETYSVVPSASPLKYGILKVGVMLSTPSRAAGGIQEGYVPVQDEHVWLALPDHTLTRLLFLYTNSTGYVSIKLLPEHYLIQIFDTRFQTSILVQVYPDSTTTLTVFASGLEHPIAFQEVQNQNASGWVSGTGSIFMAVRASAHVANVSDTVFFEKQGATSSSVSSRSSGSTTEMWGTVMDERLSNGIAWLQIRPSQPLKVPTDLPNALVTYKTTYTIKVDSSISTQSSSSP